MESVPCELILSKELIDLLLIGIDKGGEILLIESDPEGIWVYALLQNSRRAVESKRLNELLYFVCLLHIRFHESCPSEHHQN
jgi:hypothetical protein